MPPLPLSGWVWLSALSAIAVVAAAGIGVGPLVWLPWLVPVFLAAQFQLACRERGVAYLLEGNVGVLVLAATAIGPAGVALVSILGPIDAKELRGQGPLRRSVANRVVRALTGWTAAWVVLAGEASGPMVLPAALVAAAIVAEVMSMVLMGLTMWACGAAPAGAIVDLPSLRRAWLFAPWLLSFAVAAVAVLGDLHGIVVVGAAILSWAVFWIAGRSSQIQELGRVTLALRKAPIDEVVEQLDRVVFVEPLVGDRTTRLQVSRLLQVLREWDDTRGQLGAAEVLNERLAQAAARADQRERLRLGLALHDQVLPMLTLASWDADRPDAVRAHIGTAQELLRELLAALHASDGADLRDRLALQVESLGLQGRTTICVAGTGPPADESRIMELAAGMLANAAAYTTGPVRVSVVFRNGLVQLAVEDSGPGWDGTVEPGHGLALLRARVESLCGTLSVVTGPDRGTTVRIRIPTGGDGTSGC
ncbi:two-component system sensor kinase [Euzebya pacifica]|uniref:histidine kinase n=1 Tax=Euzebya pacifica TaxID=1608957 RepID=A0A346XZC4_9ACTN|nr:two-component system sensor kinase [Euzebya pacifica]